MKTILAIVAFILAFSCKTVHKATSEVKTIIDSSKIEIKDSVNVKKENTKITGSEIKNVQIKITYPTKDSTKHTIITTKPTSKSKPGTGNSISDIVNQAISASGEAGHIPSTIEINIGSISDSTKSDSKVDSTHLKENDSTKIKVNTESYNKNVKKSGPSVGDYIIISLITLIVISIFILGFKFKF